MHIDTPTNKYGEALRAQVEERLAFYEVSCRCSSGHYPHTEASVYQSGSALSKNADAIKKAQAAIALDLEHDDDDDEDMEDTAKVDEVAEVRQLFPQPGSMRARILMLFFLQAVKLVEKGRAEAAAENEDRPVDPELQKLASLIPGVSGAIAGKDKKDKKSKKR